MAPNQKPIGENGATGFEDRLSYKPEDLEDSYFGGLVKFKTKLVWPNIIFFFLLHIGAFYGVWLCFWQCLNLQFTSTIFMYFYAWLGGEGTTIGAHRLWCHRSYKARRPLRLLLIFGQTVAGQNCCHRWVKEHRQHHKYSDTDADLHNASRGLFFSHMGWLMMKRHPEAKAKSRTIYMADVERDPIVMFQKEHFKKIFFVIGILIPVSIPCLLWGETLYNSIFISLFFRYVLLLHITWTVNSLAHFFGDKPYDKDIKSSENALVSFLGYGEGWHNYHHTFPWDYKASEFGKHLNFTRDAIEFFARIGWAYDLKEASHDIMVKTMRKRGDGTHELAQHVEIEHKPVTAEEEALGW